MMRESPADDPESNAQHEHGESSAWLAREVPGIVSGLELSGQITDATARAARHLLADGRFSQALAVVLDEADR